MVSNTVALKRTQETGKAPRASTAPKQDAPERGPRARGTALGPAAEPKHPALTLAAALPNLGAQATAGHGHVALLQAQVVLLFSKPRRNTGGKTAPLDRHLRKKR